MASSRSLSPDFSNARSSSTLHLAAVGGERRHEQTILPHVHGDEAGEAAVGRERDVVGDLVGREVRDHDVVDVRERDPPQEGDDVARISDGRVGTHGQARHLRDGQRGRERVTAERVGVDHDAGLAGEPGGADGGLDVALVLDAARPDREGRNSIGQEEHDLPRPFARCALCAVQPGQLDDRELDRRGVVGRARGPVLEDPRQHRPYSVEVVGERDLHLGVLLVEGHAAAGRRIDLAREAHHPDASSPGAQRFQQEVGGADLGGQDRVTEVCADHVVRKFARHHQLGLRVEADLLVCVDVDAARVTGRVRHVDREQHVEVRGLAAARMRTPAHGREVHLVPDGLARLGGLDLDRHRRGGRRRSGRRHGHQRERARERPQCGVLSGDGRGHYAASPECSRQPCGGARV